MTRTTIRSEDITDGQVHSPQTKETRIHAVSLAWNP
jgi:hypothetical protein